MLSFKLLIFVFWFSVFAFYFKLWVGGVGAGRSEVPDGPAHTHYDPLQGNFLVQRYLDKNGVAPEIRAFVAHLMLDSVLSHSPYRSLYAKHS